MRVPIERAIRARKIGRDVGEETRVELVPIEMIAKRLLKLILRKTLGLASFEEGRASLLTQEMPLRRG